MSADPRQIVQELAEHFQPIFEASPDGIYLFVDDKHWIVSEKFARMTGYTVAELCDPSTHLLHRIVAEDDHQNCIWNFRNRVANLAYPVTFRMRMKRKDGTTFAAETDMIPLPWKGHAVAYHFVRAMRA
ncbi:MAG: PAS domain S-box protein [Alphaproteobacteria bacterium]|uniref:PAS domain S-box protein n=1 Tax=Candidatus Nitrobium versatile TaxID=2884831 RepID=A0A953J4R9_9BACT|nr:PAS domain S-box protein [Candidatus Nitrobium versatile]